MLISLKHKFCFLSQQKCGTTSIEKALKKYCEIQLTRTKYGKHANFNTYQKKWKPFINSRFKKAELKSICTTRHPISLMISWYTYKSRTGKKGKLDFTGNKSFPAWFADHLESVKFKGLNNNFFLDETKGIGPDLIFPLEKIDILESYISNRIGEEVEFKKQNASPKIHDINDFHKIAWNMRNNFPEILEKHIAFYEDLNSKYDSLKNIEDIEELTIDRNFFKG